MPEIELGSLANGPHGELIRALADKCSADPAIQAIWIGGSLAGGYGDRFSDVDFRIAVEPGQIDRWTSFDWSRYLPIQPCGSLLLRFGAQALLHHMVLADGTIVDFYVQDTTISNSEPKLVILASRNAEFRAMLEGLERPPAPLVHDIDPAVVRQFLVDYWITTHKELKALARKYDEFSFAGLYHERQALLRAWYMQLTGKDIDARMTLHVAGEMHRVLEGRLTARQHDILGLPSRTPDETAAVIVAIRAEMSAAGRSLAEQYGFVYPYDLEEVVQRSWDEHKQTVTRR